MKHIPIFLGASLAVSILGLVGWTASGEADSQVTQDVPVQLLSLHGTRPADDTRQEDAPQDPWYVPLRELTETLSDAYFDRPHATRFGMSNGEPEIGRQMRLDTFAHDVLSAVRARAGELAQFGPDAVWGYATTLVWLAHRETRIASSPRRLGSEDNGRAHGYWQVWSWKNQDQYAASTALDMLIAEPETSWSLPRAHPWTGYPECSRWLAAHPAP